MRNNGEETGLGDIDSEKGQSKNERRQVYDQYKYI